MHRNTHVWAFVNQLFVAATVAENQTEQSVNFVTDVTEIWETMETLWIHSNRTKLHLLLLKTSRWADFLKSGLLFIFFFFFCYKSGL